MQFRRRLQPNVNVDLVPMIDVVFQLVVFFMVSSTFVMSPGLNLDLPQSSTEERVVMNNTVVTAVSPDEVYLNETRYTLETLADELARMRLQSGEDGAQSVVVEADGASDYQLIVDVLDVLRRNGFRGVALRTVRPDTVSP